MKVCRDFSLNRINFLNRGSHNGVFWIVDENCVDNTPMVLAAAEQSLHRAKFLVCVFSFVCLFALFWWFLLFIYCFLCCLTSKELGMLKELGGDTARTPDPD